MVSVIIAEYHYAVCHYAECRYAECHYTECRVARKMFIKSATAAEMAFLSRGSISRKMEVHII